MYVLYSRKKTITARHGLRKIVDTEGIGGRVWICMDYSFTGAKQAHFERHTLVLKMRSRY